MDNHTPSNKPTLEMINEQLGDVSAGARAQLAGDMSVAGGSVSGGEISDSRRKNRRRS